MGGGAAHKDQGRGGKVPGADASVRGRKRHVAILPATAADSNGDSNSSDQRQAAATGNSG
jgi:hypothetical protein